VAQQVFAGVLSLATGLLFALTIQAIHIGAKYKFFPVGIKYTRFFPLEIDRPTLVGPDSAAKGHAASYGPPSDSYSPPMTYGRYVPCSNRHPLF
jgi:hypothetical protein